MLICTRNIKSLYFKDLFGSAEATPFYSTRMKHLWYRVFCCCCFNALLFRLLFKSYVFLMCYRGENVTENSTVWDGMPRRLPAPPTQIMKSAYVQSLAHRVLFQAWKRQPPTEQISLRRMCFSLVFLQIGMDLHGRAQDSREAPSYLC